MAQAGTARIMDVNLQNRDSFDYEDLIACAEGRLFGPGNAQLPAPPMLMFDRITEISTDGGAYGKGKVIAELDVKPDLWFFDCHFLGDPVMPGCLGLDALWQLVGFFIGWNGAPGRGRALGVGEVKFTGQVMPEAKLIRYEVDIKRLINRQAAIAFADGRMLVDGEMVYDINGMRVGTFVAEESGSEGS